jgi:glycosyltransferase involved in cell wall biosynthesis
MQPLPRISVVTPSLNQGAFLERTIASVEAQEYPDLEHVVVDGLSIDATPDILARHPRLRVIREKDRGQADALNKGLRAATGAVLCVLNSDDTFAPGALRRVAAEIDPAAGRHVVLGRCRFVDEQDRFLGVEHPSGFESHRRVLEIWKGHALPQPAIFWTREAWERCGPFDEAVGPFLDYDFFCRLSREFDFHYVDQVLAHYRLHPAAQTAAMADRERLERAIAVSRRHWGPKSRRLYWRLLGSWLAYRLDRRRRAVGLMRRGRESWRRGRPLPAVGPAMAGALLAPDVLADVVVLPVLRTWARRAIPASLLAPPSDPHTRAWRDFDGVHADGWVGPVLARTVEVPQGPAHLRLRGTRWSSHVQRGMTLAFFLDGQPLAHRDAGRGSSFAITVPLTGVSPGPHQLRVEASACVIPDRHLGNRDRRPLAFRLDGLDVAAGAPPDR